MRIDPNRLMRLAVLINQRSFRSAADKLALTQPALSQSIAQLEDEVGVQLITRSARGIEPTVYGEVLYKHAKAVDQELAQATQKIQGMISGSAGSLRLGAATGGGIQIAAQAVCQFKSAHPSANVDISEDVLVGTLLAQLHERSLDLVICHRQNDFDLKSVKAIKLFPTRKVLCVRSGHPLQGSHDLAALVEYPFLCPPDEMGVLSDIKSLFKDNEVEFPHDMVVSNSLTLAKEVVMNSDAFAIFSDIAVLPERRAGKLATREVPGSQQTWYCLVTRPEFVPSELMKAFLHEVLEVCEQWGIEPHEDARWFQRYGR